MKKTFIYFAISFFYVFPYILQGQNNTAVNSNFTLQNVILPDTKPTEWTEIRERIKNRILNDWGTTPEAFEPRKNEYVVTEKYSKFGLQHMVVRYHVTENIWDKAIIVLPPDFSEKKTYKGFLAIHGSNLEKGGYQNTDPEKYPRRAYAYEMALKGFVAIAPDHFGFGDTLGTGGIAKQNQIIQDFYKEYPDWTLVGRQILGFMRALDVFDQLPYVEKDNYSAMGNSLGGRTSLYIAAFDERIKAAVTSTGISPFSTNVYRGLPKIKTNHPSFWKQVEKNGKFPYEVHELIALIAPRSLLVIEPFNDPYNPYTFNSVHAIFLAEEVWKLLNAERKINILIHGDGHDTVDNIRTYAYEWIKLNTEN